MRGITVRATLVMLALIAALYLPTQRTGAQEPAKFDLAKAITGSPFNMCSDLAKLLPHLRVPLSLAWR